MKKTRKEINEKDACEAFIRICKALGDKGRCMVFKMLLEKKKMCVSDIAEIMKISMPAASKQLKMLEMANCVRSERRGKTICYTVRNDNPVIEKMKKCIEMQKV